MESIIKTALITGGSSGIGQGIAVILAEEGYDIAITYGKNPEGAETTKEKIEALGRKCFCIQASMQQADVPEHMVKQAVEALGHIDLLVNNAGAMIYPSILLSTAENMDYLYGVNYRGYLLTAGAVARHMVLKGIQGNIIFITSSRAERSYPNDYLYGGFKAAVKRSCESLAMELSPFGIRVNCVAPGATRNRIGQSNSSLEERIPVPRLGTPQENGHVVAFLASEKAAYITGITVRVDGGLILPGMPERDFDNPLKKGWGSPIIDEEFMNKVKLRDEQ